MSAIDDQGRLLRELAEGTKDGSNQTPRASTSVSHETHDDLEMMSRKDVPWTPITGADKLLSWSVFPQERPVTTLPASVHTPKLNPYANRKSRASSTFQEN